MSTATIPVHAYAIAATVAPKDVEPLFDARATRVKVSKTEVVVRFDKTGWAVAYDFGAVVFFGCEDADRAAFLKAMTTRFETEHRPAVEETFLIEVAPGTPPSSRFDRVVLAELDQRGVELVALVIGQSVAMEYYEEDVDELVGEIDLHARALADTGSFRGRGRDLLRFVGRGMATRNQVVHTLSLLDAPAIVWDSEPLDRLYRDLRGSFAIEDRYRALDHKLHMIQDSLVLLVDLTRHRRSVLLEMLVVVLIAVELVVAVLQLRH